MRLLTRLFRISIAAVGVFCFLAATSNVSAQTAHRRERVTRKSAKVSVARCQHSRVGTLCGPPVKLVAHAADIGAQNKVTVQVLIDEGGTVISARAVSGDRKLWDKAVADAKQNKFAPKRLGGKPVKVNGVIVYIFEKP